MKYSDIIEILKSKRFRYPQKTPLIPLPFNPFSSSSKARAMINAQVKAPIAFSPQFGDRTQIYLVDESGTPDPSDVSAIFQLGIVQGNQEILASISEEIKKLRSTWKDREGESTKFHHSKDTATRRQLFEEYCLKRSNVSFLHYKLNKRGDQFRVFDQEHKATIYFSALLSAIHDTQFSHGKIKIIASDRPNTFSDNLVYELKRVARVQALIDMVNIPGVRCCLPDIELQRMGADTYPVLDLCDYLIAIMGRSDHSFQYKYGGCSLFEASDNFEGWTVHETYYSNDLVVPEGRLLRFLKSRPWTIPQNSPIIFRILQMKSLPDSLMQCARDIERSENKDEFLGSIISLATIIGPYLDTKYWSIPLFEYEYLMIKSIGAYFKLLLDYGVAADKGDPFSGKAQFLYLNWR